MTELERSPWQPSWLGRSEIEAVKSGENDVWFLPDRIKDDSKEPLAGFRPEVQALQSELREQGIRAGLLAPDGYRKAPYSEHCAEWVLPTVLTLASLPIGVVSGTIANYLTKASAGDPSGEVRYREVHFDPESEGFELIEAEGPAQEVVQLLEERSDSASSG